jgi:hypothetical protein
MHHPQFESAAMLMNVQGASQVKPNTASSNNETLHQQIRQNPPSEATENGMKHGQCALISVTIAAAAVHKGLLL